MRQTLEFARLPEWPAVMCMSLLLTACTSSSDVPPWFDALYRYPVKTIQVEGHRIAYLDVGTGPPVILVHGFGGSMWQWEYQQAALAHSHRVITPDLLGSGLSDKPLLQYTPDEVVAFFTGFMDALGIQRAALVGNSMGAAVVMGMVLTHPERVERLVLVGGLPDHVRDKLTSPLVKRAVDSRIPVWIAKVGNWFAGRGTTERILKEIVYDQSLITPAVIERGYQNRTRPGLMPPLLALVRNLPLWEQGFALRIKEIRSPTLVIWGEQDRIFPPEVGRELHGMIAGSSYEAIPESGHIPQWERPDVFNKMILKFLASSQS